MKEGEEEGASRRRGKRGKEGKKGISKVWAYTQPPVM